MRYRFLFITQFLVCFSLAGIASAQWIQTNSPKGNRINTLSFSGMNMYAGTDSGLFLSTDRGLTWTEVDSGMTSKYVNDLAIEGANIYAATIQGVWRSTVAAMTWTRTDSGLTHDYAEFLTICDSNLFAACPQNEFYDTSYGLYRSTDHGASWNRLKVSFPCNLALTTIDSEVLVSGYYYDRGGGAGYLYISRDGGDNWDSIGGGLPGGSTYGIDVQAIAGYQDKLGTRSIFVAPGMNGIFRSTDDGANWTAVKNGLTNLDIGSLTIRDTLVFAGAYAGATDRGIFVSLNCGASWSLWNDGLSPSASDILVADDSNLYDATYDNGLWRRPLSDIVTSVQRTTPEEPASFVLSQNYPNPFNPSTNISYQLPVNSTVVLKLFGVLGKEVGTLVNERQSAGNHSVMFNAVDLPSGVYFYSLQAGSYHDIRKMLLLK